MAQKLKTIGVVTVVTTGTRVALSGTATVSSNIQIQADPANTGKIYIGDNTVSTTNGIALEASQDLELVGDVRRGGGDEYRLDEIFIDADVSGEKVRVLISGKP